MLGGRSGVEIVVAPGLLLACGADTHHVALRQGLHAGEGRLVDAERFQKPRQLVAGVRALADEAIEVGGSDGQILRDPCKIAAIDPAKLADFLP